MCAEVCGELWSRKVLNADYEKEARYVETSAVGPFFSHKDILNIRVACRNLLSTKREG